jgi:predicted kinase
MIGLPASGKSTLAWEYATKFNAKMHSSDELRKELYGNYNVFDKNTLLFEELHTRILSDLSKGINCIYDATNLSMKRRKSFIKTVHKDVEIIAIVMATSYEDCIKRDNIRDKKVGEHIITSMRKNFQFPLLTEGFSSIVVEYSSDFEPKDLLATFNSMSLFDQDNPNHRLTLGRHCQFASHIAFKKKYNHEICLALLTHDLGKLYTKTYRDKNGNTTDIAHYYDHHNVSAYEYMFYFKLDNDIDIYICQLINYHMQPYFIKTEKSKKKWLDIFGEKMYNDIILINECDRLAH